MSHTASGSAQNSKIVSHTTSASAKNSKVMSHTTSSRTNKSKVMSRTVPANTNTNKSSQPFVTSPEEEEHLFLSFDDVIHCLQSNITLFFRGRHGGIYLDNGKTLCYSLRFRICLELPVGMVLSVEVETRFSLHNPRVSCVDTVQLELYDSVKGTRLLGRCLNTRTMKTLSFFPVLSLWASVGELCQKRSFLYVSTQFRKMRDHTLA